MKNFTKKDIQTGDIVVTSNQGNAIVIAGRLKKHDMLLNEAALSHLDSYTNDLCHKSYEEFTIDKVYTIDDCYDYSLEELINDLPEDKVSLKWERKKEIKIDWSKVPAFTKVLVRNKGQFDWTRQYFIRQCNNRYTTTDFSDFIYPIPHSQCDSLYSHWDEIMLYDENDVTKYRYK